VKRQTALSLDMFQDPLLTIVGLILFGTIWLVIPGKIVPSREDALASFAQVESLRNETQTLRLKLVELERTLTNVFGNDPSRAAATLADLERHVADESLAVASLEQKLRDTSSLSMIENVEELLQNRKEGLEQLRLVLDIAELRKTASAKLESVRIFEGRARSESADGTAVSGRLDEQGRTSRDRNYVEIADGRLYPVDGSHYSATQYGQYVVAVRKKLSGESLDWLGGYLDDLNKGSDCVIFMLHRTSFPLFRRARSVAFNRGFEVGWVALTFDTLVIGPGDGDGEGPPTWKPRPGN
jgi:hypothetical protein